MTYTLNIRVAELLYKLNCNYVTLPFLSSNKNIKHYLEFQELHSKKDNS